MQGSHIHSICVFCVQKVRSNCHDPQIEFLSGLLKNESIFALHVLQGMFFERAILSYVRETRAQKRFILPETALGILYNPQLYKKHMNVYQM